MALTYSEGGRRLLDCPRCGMAARVDLHGDRLSIRCYGLCEEQDVLDALDIAALRGELASAKERSNGARPSDVLASEVADAASSWTPIELAAILEGRPVHPPPSILARTDGRRLIYAGERHSAFGEPECGKTWLALAACAEVLVGGARALYVDFEDRPETAVERLLALGVSIDAIRDRFSYVGPDEPVTDAGRAEMVALGVELAVIDGVTEAMVLHGLSPDSNEDAARWGHLLPAPLARSGTAVIELDHVTKDRESRGRYAIGAQHKLGGVKAAYRLDLVEPFRRGGEGVVKITVSKDRPGHVRQHQGEGGRIADMRLASGADGSVTVRLEGPAAGERGEFRPTHLMERVSRAIEAEPGMTTTAIRAIPGSNDGIDAALRVLLHDGFIEVRQEGQAKRHHSAKPYREADDLPDPAPLPEPCRNPAGAGSESNPAALPTPVGAGGRGHGTSGTADPAAAEEGA